jgi:hypothetical protein
VPVELGAVEVEEAVVVIVVVVLVPVLLEDDEDDVLELDDALELELEPEPGVHCE